MQQSAERQEEKCRQLHIFSDRLKSRRLRLGLSQESLAINSKTGARSVVAWEQGKNLPNGIKLNQLADALGVTASWLLGEDSTEVATGESRLPMRTYPAAASSVYSLREEVSGSGPATEEQCMEHLRRFLETCERDASKIGWTKIELQESFPLNKWKKNLP